MHQHPRREVQDHIFEVEVPVLMKWTIPQRRGEPMQLVNWVSLWWLKYTIAFIFWFCLELMGFLYLFPPFQGFPSWLRFMGVTKFRNSAGMFFNRINVSIHFKLEHSTELRQQVVYLLFPTHTPGYNGCSHHNSAPIPADSFHLFNSLVPTGTVKGQAFGYETGDLLIL